MLSTETYQCIVFYFLKLRPIFDRLSLLVGNFERFFLGGMLILGQKPFFLGPTIFKVSQPNWHWHVCEVLIFRLTVDTLRKTADNKNEFVVHTKSLLFFSRLKWWEFHLCRGCKRSNSENCHFSRTPFISRNEVGFNTKKPGVKRSHAIFEWGKFLTFKFQTFL